MKLGARVDRSDSKGMLMLLCVGWPLFSNVSTITILLDNNMSIFGLQLVSLSSSGHKMHHHECTVKCRNIRAHKTKVKQYMYMYNITI